MTNLVRALIPLAAYALTGCGSGLVGAPGPSTGAIMDTPSKGTMQGIALLELGEASQFQQTRSRASFAELLGNAQPVGQVVRPGDLLEVSIWEAPPATLFGAGGGDSRVTAGSVQVSRQVTLPPTLIDSSGWLFVPFAGSIRASGRSPEQIQSEIVSRLSTKAHLPQAIVRIVRNATANVTVVGEVANSTRMELTPKGERLLDAIAQAGGTRQPVGKTTIQLTRGDKIVAMPLSAVINDPSQNVVLATDDVITAIFQPFSFTVLGATGRNEEVNFEATGVTLAQALGRIGGIQGDRANPKGVFIFRWEKPEMVPAGLATVARADGMVPVIYRVNLKDPATFFRAQNFEMQNRDIVYVANAPVAEFQQFVGLVASTVLPVVGVVNSLP